jgi:hypothetical protein
MFFPATDSYGYTRSRKNDTTSTYPPSLPAESAPTVAVAVIAGSGGRPRGDDRARAQWPYPRRARRVALPPRLLASRPYRGPTAAGSSATAAPLSSAA